MDIGRTQIAYLTSAKAVTNGALRWIPFFFVTLEGAFGASTAALAAIVGFGEMIGLTAFFAGRTLDAGNERWVMVASLASVSLSGLISLHGSLIAFAIGFAFLMLGSANMTAAGHAWISARSPFHRRARFIGAFETSWAVGLLIGAPVMALLISQFGWRGPFVATSLAAAVALLFLARMDEAPRTVAPAAGDGVSFRLSPDAWVMIAASASIAMTGLSTLVVVGSWLSDDLGVSTGGIGLVAILFGTAELAASMSSAAFADAAGKRRTTQIAMSAVVAGLAVMALTGSSLLVGALGLLLFFFGFEYSIVTSFSLVSESMPEARGRAISTSNALGTVVRGGGAVLAGLLYEAFGIRGAVTLSSATALLAIALLTLAGRRGAPS